MTSKGDFVNVTLKHTFNFQRKEDLLLKRKKGTEEYLSMANTYMCTMYDISITEKG
jgi:hypothetical protein